MKNMPRKPYVSKAKIKIDSHKHDDQIKAIEEAIREEARLAELEIEYAEDEEASYEEEDEFEDLEIETDQPDDPYQVGRIDLSFPETIEEFSDSIQCYPPSYYTLSPKERLLLLYAENFRHQFVINNCKRRPLVLALPNECNVQKFVCTTIRPTAFIQRPLIRNAEECASFVADFIIYESLDDMMRFEGARKNVANVSHYCQKRHAKSYPNRLLNFSKNGELVKSKQVRVLYLAVPNVLYPQSIWG